MTEKDKKNLEDTLMEFANFMQNDSEFVSIVANENDLSFDEKEVPSEMPILPLRGNVLFPGVIAPLTAARSKAIKLIKDAKRKKLFIGVMSQINDSDDPKLEDLCEVGTVVSILKTLDMPNGNMMVIVQGVKRFRIDTVLQEEPYMRATVSSFVDAQLTNNDSSMNIVLDEIKEAYGLILKTQSNIPNEGIPSLKNLHNPRLLINFISSHVSIEVLAKQQLLELDSLNERAIKLLEHLSTQIKILEVRNEIYQKVRGDLDKQQRDMFLNQQLKAIQEELGGSPNEQEIRELEEKAENKKWTKEVADIFYKEMGKLQRLHPSSPDFSVQLNYLNTIVDLPWGDYTSDNFDTKHAAEVLNADHFGLEKVKQRILEYLAVLKLKGDMKSPILCLVGPPGVGKTSLGKSISMALGRKYIRMALGGLRDEAEIRGHRKTYIGAMPGRIIQNILKAKSSNPVFLLDEIDKVMGMSVNGDPASALLEVLDPEQNSAFHDNYLDIDYDLSKVLFIATANTLSTIHPALLDRMEVIDIAGYILEEKIEIAKRHLIPKQLKEHGIKTGKIEFPDNTIKEIIDKYTRESGVRMLEKNIAKLIRGRAIKIAEKEKMNKEVKDAELKTVLGLPIHNSDTILKENTVGVVTGLAWTSVGGEILFIEASISKGKGMMSMTGNLGDVMKESATLAYEYLKSNADVFNITTDVFDNYNVHIHVPQGATPKDGPSAGITIFTALTSVFTKKKVHADYAMTGEITLRGKVLPVGGIKEKILAAKRSNVTDIVLSKENKRDVEDINKEYIEGLHFHYVENVSELPKIMLIK